MALQLFGARGPAASLMAEDAHQAGSMTEAEQLALRALRISLVYPEPIRILGLTADARGQHRSAALLMATAASWSWRDTETQLWLMRQALAGRDYPAMMKHVDALLRRQVSRKILFELLSAGSELYPDFTRAVVPHLEAMPKWRGAFFDPHENPSIGSPGFDKLVFALNQSSAPPSRNEISGLMKVLFERKEYERAGRVGAAYSPKN